MRTFTLITLIFAGGLTFSQHIDLQNFWYKQGLDQEPDSTRLEKTILFARENYVFNQPDSAVILTRLVYDYALERNDMSAQSEALNVMGIAYTIMDQDELALEKFNASIAIDYVLHDSSSIANKLNNIGIIYKNNSELILSETYFNQALDLAVSIHDLRIMGLVYNNLGNLYKARGLNSDAMDYFKKSLAVKRQMNDRKSMAASYISLASAAHNTNQFELGLIYADSASQMPELQKNNYLRKTLYFHYGDLYRNTSQFDKAIEVFNQSLEMDMKLNDISGMSWTYQRLADLYDIMQQAPQALDNLHKAYALSQTLKEFYLDRTIARLYVRAYAHTGNSDSSFHHMEVVKKSLYKEINIYFYVLSQREREEQNASYMDNLELYSDFALHFADSITGVTDSALNTVLMSKGLALRSTTLLRSQILESEDSALISLYDDWLMLRNQIAGEFSTGKPTDSLEARAEILEKQLYAKLDNDDSFTFLLNPNWMDIRNSLKVDECAIEFAHFRNSIDPVDGTTYVAYVIRPEYDHPRIVRLCTQADLELLLGKFQGNNADYIKRVYGNSEQFNKDLYQKIWQPIEPLLKDIKTVYYSPSGLLHKISFAAVSKEQNVLLSDLYDFRLMGSTSNVAYEKSGSLGELENFLLMGGVNYNSDTTAKEIWSYLPGSLAETDAIHNLATKKKYGINYFSQDHASEGAFKEKISSSSIVHIATHGFFFPDPEQVRTAMKSDSEVEEIEFRGTTNYASWSFVNNKNPLMRSGIVLANANDVWQRSPFSTGEDGILTAQEVSSLDLRNTKLVVLSACETGLGDIRGSEGVYGLQRAFKMAGVKYMIMSLWQVPDKETSEFMILFYKNLIKLEDIPTAFQKTQKAMREKYDPYYWAAFVLIE